MAEPTANFGPEATQLSAPQAAGANPTEGVQSSSYTPNLAPIANLVEGVSDLFGKLKKDKAAEADQKNLSGFSNELAEAEQEYEQTGDANKFAVRKGQVIRKWQVQAPHLAGEFKKVLGVAQEGTTGRADDALKLKKEFEKDALMEGYKNGIPNVPGNEKTTIDAVLATRRYSTKQKELFETMERESKMAGWADDEKKRRMKEESGSLLVELSGSHLVSFNANLAALAKKVAAGMDPAEATQQVMGQYSSIRAMIDSIAVHDSAMAEPFRRQFDQVFDAYKPYFAKGADVEGIENLWKKTQAAANMNYIAKDPQLMEMFTYSKSFANQPSLYTTIHPVLQKKLASMGVSEALPDNKTAKGVSPQIIGNPADEKQALKVVKGFVKNSLDGKMSGEDAKIARKEVYGQLKGMMTQYAESYQLGKLDKESRKNMNEFLLDPDVARFIKENPLPISVARGLAAAGEDNFKQFQRTFNEETKDLLKGADIRSATQKMGGRGMSGQNQKPVTTESVNPVDAVNISWRNGSIVFDPVNMPVDRTDQNLLITKLNTLQTVFSNGVRIAAAIQGEDPQTFFDKNKHKLFPEKFEAPANKGEIDKSQNPDMRRGSPTPTDRPDNPEEAKIRREVNSDPLTANGTPADNVRQIRAELKKTKDPAKIEILMDELEKELDKMR